MENGGGEERERPEDGRVYFACEEANARARVCVCVWVHVEAAEKKGEISLRSRRESEKKRVKALGVEGGYRSEEARKGERNGRREKKGRKRDREREKKGRRIHRGSHDGRRKRARHKREQLASSSYRTYLFSTINGIYI